MRLLKRAAHSVPIDADILGLGNASVLAFVAFAATLGIVANAATRNAVRLYAMQYLSGGDGTLVMSTSEHVDTLFTSGCQTSVTTSLEPRT